MVVRCSTPPEWGRSDDVLTFDWTIVGDVHSADAPKKPSKKLSKKKAKKTPVLKKVSVKKPVSVKPKAVDLGDDPIYL